MLCRAYGSCSTNFPPNQEHDVCVPVIVRPTQNLRDTGYMLDSFPYRHSADRWPMRPENADLRQVDGVHGRKYKTFAGTGRHACDTE